MKSALLLAAAALACGAAFAQAPAGVVKNPSQETNPNMSGGKAQVKGEMNAESKGSSGGMAANSTATMGGYRAMDANGDGYVSRKEWNNYHGKMWGTMKPNKKGLVPWADVDAKLRGGPN